MTYETRSESSSAAVFGANSPNTIWRNVINENAMANEMAWSTVGVCRNARPVTEPSQNNTGSSSDATAGSPIQPRPRDESVIPNCVAEMYALRLFSIPSSRTAALSPSAAWVSIRDLRTATSANSLATKKPFAATRTITEIMLRSDQPTVGVATGSETSTKESRNNKLAGSSIPGKCVSTGLFTGTAYPYLSEMSALAAAISADYITIGRR